MTAALQFTIDGLAPDALRTYAVDGTEALSSLYSFDIDCLGQNGRALDSLALVGQRATLRITVEGAQPRSVHGIIDAMEIEPPSIFGDARYRFRLVPWLARLELSRSNQIHGTADAVSVPDVIEAELSGALRPTAQVSDTDFRRFEHELRLRDRDAYPKRDHVSQYEETDFAFISRLAEHAGIFYFFENNGDRESVVFADDNLFATPLEGGTELQWKPWGSGGREAAPDTIQAIRQRSKRVPQKVWLQDHNYRLPHIPLLVEAEVDSRGRGNWVEYGAHHRTPEEGNTLARIRAQELRCHQSRWNGNSTVARLAPGRVIRLGGHPYTSWNQDYLVVRVRHEVWVPMPGVPESDWVGYRNSFELIDRDVPFRPARVTPVPRMDGLLNGKIDGAGDGSKAEIDDQGRYRVKVPFDLGGSPDGKASQWIRMSSPFGGDGDGMHFPLFPDTEVVIGCVNGDPDRPVILGAVPNPRNKSVVTEENSSHNRLVSRAGMGFEMSVNMGGTGGGGGSNSATGALNAYGPPSANLATPAAMGGAAATVLASPSALAAGKDINDADNFARVYVQRGGAAKAITDELRLGVPPTVSGDTAEPASLKTPGSFAWKAGTYNANATKVTDGKPFATDANGAMIYTSGHGLVRADGPVGVTSGGILRMTSGVTTATDAPASGKGGGAEFTSVNGDIQLVAVKEAVAVPEEPTQPTTQPDLAWRNYDVAMKNYQSALTEYYEDLEQYNIDQEIYENEGYGTPPTQPTLPLEPTRPVSDRPTTPSPEWAIYDKNVADRNKIIEINDRTPGITIHAVGAIKIVSQSDISITANGKISQKSYKDTSYETVGDDTVTVYANKRNHVWGLQTDFFMGMKSTFNFATLNTVTLGATTSTSLALSFSLFLGGRIDLTFGARFSTVFGWNNSINLGGSLSSTAGLATSSFTGGRITNITGNDTKFVIGLDAKKVDFALDLKGVDLASKFTQAQKDEVKAWQAGIEAGNTNLSAEATAALRVFL